MLVLYIVWNFNRIGFIKKVTKNREIDLMEADKKETKQKCLQPFINKGLQASSTLLDCYIYSHKGSRGRGARTPIYGFGDRCSTIELFP